MATPAARIAGLALAAALAPLPAPAAGEDSARPHSGPALPYEVVDGLAIQAGDIVLGTAEEVAARSRRAPGTAPGRREIALVHDEPPLWPEGVIPFVIDERLPPEATHTIAAAIAAWNSQTVISLRPRTNEPDYIRFVPSERCASHVGRKGGEQLVWAGQGPGCGVRQLAGAIHEIGHVVGLGHEHQRSDRDAYVTVSYDDLDPHWREWYAPHRRPARPYDFRSTMHYWMAVESIPPGIEIAPGGLSAGDIDGVARLYGHPPSATTIATNPPGLTVWVDGIAHEAPAQFDWQPGTAHTVEVRAEPQHRPGSRYVFGRWNDEAPRLRTVTAAEGGTWLEANFVVQHRVIVRSEPAPAGEVDVSPPSDGWYTRGTRIDVAARPAPRSGMAFWRWNRWAPHGLAANPATIPVADEPLSLVAYFSADPLLRITSNTPSFVLDLDARWHLAPTALAVPPGGRSASVRIADTQPSREQAGSRYRFERWSDGVDAQEREIALRPGGGELGVIFSTQHALRASSAPPAAGSVSVHPPAEEGFHAAGTEVTATATANEGWEFARWTGTASAAASATMSMDAPRVAEAWFTRTRQLRPGSPEAVSLPTEAAGFRLAAPEGASGIALRFTPDAPAPQMEMQIRAFSSPREPGLHAWERLHAYSAWRGWLQGAEFVAKPADGPLEVSIGHDTDPPLDPDALYFVVLVSDGTPVSGTLSLEVTSSGPRPPLAKAWPRAFTFVSEAGTDPPPQNFELRNEGGSAMHFEAAPEAAWLAADPPRGSVAPGESLELAVRVAGQVPADTHAATLDLSLDGPYGALPQLRLPVTFVAVPPPAAPAAE